MKALLISDLPRSSDDLNSFFSEYKFDLIHYHSPIKALDNIQEIKPNMIIINARDFPRHWKPITQHIRWDNSKEDILIVLLTPADFSANDADKAMVLGVQGIIELKETGNYQCVLEDLQMIFKRYNYGQTKNIENDVQFLFTHPVDETIITGTVKKLTQEGLLFLPDTPAATDNLTQDTILEQCSLKINNGFIVPNCKIISNKNILDLNFMDLSDEDKETISAFLN